MMYEMGAMQQGIGLGILWSLCITCITIWYVYILGSVKFVVVRLPDYVIGAKARKALPPSTA